MKRDVWSVLYVATFVASFLFGAELESPPTVGTAALTLGVTCTPRAGGDLPDPNCTPGDVATHDTKEVCSEHTRDVRDVTESTRKKVFAEYGVSWPQPAGSYEVDHLISLELGGSNDESNLWPEPAPRFHDKDKIENYLHREVCAGRMTLEDAQAGIARDWRQFTSGRRWGWSKPR